MYSSLTDIMVIIFFNHWHFVCPFVYFLLCSSCDRGNWHYFPEFERVPCDILVCIIYDTNFDILHNESYNQFLFVCKYSTLNYIQLIIYFFKNVSFQLYALEVHPSFLVCFFTFPFYTCFPFSSAALKRCLSTINLYSSGVTANGCLLICLLSLC
jgi:hypothetical protein